MRKLVKVEVAFDLMNKNDVYEANVEDARTKRLLEVGYLSLVEGSEQLLVAQDESDLQTESTAKVGTAPRVKKQQGGKVSD